MMMMMMMMMLFMAFHCLTWHIFVLLAQYRVHVCYICIDTYRENAQYIYYVCVTFRPCVH